MLVELNIGLDCKDQPNTQVDIDARAAMARRMLSKFLVFSRGFYTSYPGPDGAQVNERGLFVTLETNNLFSASREIFKTAIALDQDCIAVYYPGRSQGLLLGPRAEAWGQFDANHFRRFDRADERLAA